MQNMNHKEPWKITPTLHIMILNGLHTLKHPRITAAALLAYTYNTWIGKVHLNLRKIKIGVNLVPSAMVHQCGIGKSRKT